jgi:hypothetical protein
MANTHFSSTRFKRLIKAYFTENGRMLYRATIAYFILSFSIWMIITSLLISNHDSFNLGVQVFLFVLNGFIFPILASGWFYGRLNSTERQISFLVVPATHLEKHLLASLMSIVLPVFIGIGGYYIGEICGMALHTQWAKPSVYYSNFHYLDFYGTPLIKEVLDSKSTTIICLSYLGFIGFGITFFQFFTLHFTRYAFFKIALLMLSLITFIMIYVYVALESSNINENALFRYTSYLYQPNGPDSYSSDGEILLFVVPCLASALVLWVSSYIRLKEYQLQ